VEHAKREMRKKQELEERFKTSEGGGAGSDEDSDVEDEDKIRDVEEGGARPARRRRARARGAQRRRCAPARPSVHRARSRARAGARRAGFSKLEKRVRTTGGGSSGTVRNLRIREDTAKYLLNLDPSSAHYDPKSRSMREDPLPYKDASQKNFTGDNVVRRTGDYFEWERLAVHAYAAHDKGQDIHVQASPSQARPPASVPSPASPTFAARSGLTGARRRRRRRCSGSSRLRRRCWWARAWRAWRRRTAARPRPQTRPRCCWGRPRTMWSTTRAAACCAATRARPVRATRRMCTRATTPRCAPRRLLAAKQCGKRRARAARAGVGVSLADAAPGAQVWGSWWADGRWGFACCHQTARNSYCTGAAGEAAAAEAAVQMAVNLEQRALQAERAAERAADGQAAVRASPDHCLRRPAKQRMRA